MCDIKVDLFVPSIEPNGMKTQSLRTLFVIFGPLAASVECARKRNPAVSMRSREITIRCRLAMSNRINWTLTLEDDVEEQGQPESERCSVLGIPCLEPNLLVALGA